MTQATQTATSLLRERHEQIKSMFEETLAASGDARAELFDCLRATLAVHETVEEMLVHPIARQVGPEADAVVEARLAEEKEATKKLAELEKLGANGDQFARHLATFQQAVLKHAEAEENELFPLMERGCDPAKLSDLADAIRVAEAWAPTHAHPHAPSGPVGLLVTGPFVAMVDKVRDKLATLRSSQ